MDINNIISVLQEEMGVSCDLPQETLSSFVVKPVFLLWYFGKPSKMPLNSRVKSFERITGYKVAESSARYWVKNLKKIKKDGNTVLGQT